MMSFWKRGWWDWLCYLKSGLVPLLSSCIGQCLRPPVPTPLVKFLWPIIVLYTEPLHLHAGPMHSPENRQRHAQEYKPLLSLNPLLDLPPHPPPKHTPQEHLLLPLSHFYPETVWWIFYVLSGTVNFNLSSLKSRMKPLKMDSSSMVSLELARVSLSQGMTRESLLKVSSVQLHLL